MCHQPCRFSPRNSSQSSYLFFPGSHFVIIHFVCGARLLVLLRYSRWEYFEDISCVDCQRCFSFVHGCIHHTVISRCPNLFEFFFPYRSTHTNLPAAVIVFPCRQSVDRLFFPNKVLIMSHQRIIQTKEFHLHRTHFFPTEISLSRSSPTFVLFSKTLE